MPVVTSGAPMARGPWLDDPDVRLMLRVQRGDAAAFGRLVERHRPRVFALMLRTCRDRGEAEDATQEVFLRLYRSRKRYVPRARFSTWIFHIANNVTRNALRRKQRNAWLQFGTLERQRETLLVEHRQPEPPAQAERQEMVAAVRNAVGCLVERQKKVLEMYQFQHKSYEEIASALALSPLAIKSLLHRARLRLREPLSHALCLDVC